MDEIKQIYIEPTSRCNLKCPMCMRKKWVDEAEEDIDFSLFNKLMNQLPDSVNRIFFGGIGEPLCHPNIIEMISLAKQTGRTVEMITNGTLLDKKMSKGIVDAGINKLWISIDSLENESYEGIRGTKLHGVLENIKEFNKQRGWVCWGYHSDDSLKTMLCVAFVLQKRNLSQFKQLLEKSHTLGIAEIKATHLLPYDKSQADQICYNRMHRLNMHNEPDNYKIKANMPIMEAADILEHGLLPTLERSRLTFSFMDKPYYRSENYCKFVREGIAYVRVDGEVSPCVALLHNNSIWQQDTERHIRHASFGNVKTIPILKIWENDEYASFRKRVTTFDFSPCSHCAPCDLFKSNDADCSGNIFPTCGGCLWAQGFIQCP